MPCWTKQENTVELGRVDPELVKAAALALGYSNLHEIADGFEMDHFGYTSSVVLIGGVVRVTSARSDSGELRARTNEFKRAYSGEVVKAAAVRFGWRVTEAGPNKYQVQRRA